MMFAENDGFGNQGYHSTKNIKRQSSLTKGEKSYYVK
jgi:hypothetical protein